MSAKRRTELIVALDVDSLDKAKRLRDALSGVVSYFKVGKELFTVAGPAALDALADDKVFLDLKFHDIPNTVASAVRVAASRGVAIVDVHASGGRAMLEAAVAAAKSAEAPPAVFGVTVLTHLGDEDLREMGLAASSVELVVRLAKLADEAGLDGVVASALELEAVLESTEGRLDVLVPGVRPAWADSGHDQKRIATPASAARSGARYIVMGRAITLDPSPRDAALRVLEEIDAS